MAEIKFGTDGWRAVVGKDFTQEGVEKVTNAVGKYIVDNYDGREILIGYDPRNMAKEFAKVSAELLSRVGFKVRLSRRVVPTPVLAYGCKKMGCCAIMFTASHNPPEYLGMKFIPDFAGPATSEITNELMGNLDEVLEPVTGGVVEEYEFFDEYFEHVKSLISFDKIKDVEIIFEGLYSATVGYFDKILDEYGISYESLHMYHDPNFGGGMPEPKPKYMDELMLKVKERGVAGFANDGDGDRFGVVNENGEYVSPNEVIAILLKYLVEEKGLKGCIVKTVGASLMLNILADKLGVEVVETAVGFKHVGAAMRENDTIIGGEESGGLSIQGHIPEKDGILANLLVLEAMAVKGMTLVQLQEELKDFVGVEFINERVDLKLQSQDMVKNALEKANALSEVGEYRVCKKDMKDGVKIYFDDNLSWVLVRASGTEPLLRIYFETDSVEKLDYLKPKIVDLLD